VGNNEIKKTTVLKGIGVSPGIVSGNVYLYNCQDIQTSYYKLDTNTLVTKELKRFRKALKDSVHELTEIKKKQETERESNHSFLMFIS